MKNVYKYIACACASILLSVVITKSFDFKDHQELAVNIISIAMMLSLANVWVYDSIFKEKE